MKSLVVIVFFFASFAVEAGTASVKISSVGCSYGEGAKTCWVDLAPGEAPIPTFGANCASHTQIHWYEQADNGADSTGAELFSTALMAFSQDLALKINVYDYECLSLGSDSPRVRWMSIDK